MNSYIIFLSFKLWENICRFYQQVGARIYTDNNSTTVLHSSAGNWIIIRPLLPTRLPNPPSHGCYLWASTSANEHTPIYRGRNLQNNHTQYRKFLGKNFKQFSLTCSPGVKHDWELKALFETLSSTLGRLHSTDRVPLLSWGMHHTICKIWRFLGSEYKFEALWMTPSSQVYETGRGRPYKLQKNVIRQSPNTWSAQGSASNRVSPKHYEILHS